MEEKVNKKEDDMGTPLSDECDDDTKKEGGAKVNEENTTSLLKSEGEWEGKVEADNEDFTPEKGEYSPLLYTLNILYNCELYCESVYSVTICRKSKLTRTVCT